MSQTLHILKKDIRHLRLEISLFLLVTAMFAFAERFLGDRLGARALLTIASAYLIARVIHAEAVPGDNQFWISRPYRWKSLLGAKLLFIFIFINLPILFARLFLLVLAGFPLSSSLPGLLWSHFLILFVASLPIAALATVTGGLVPFIFYALVILAVVIGIQEMMMPPFSPSVRTLIDGVQWVWDAMAAIALSAAAIPIVCIQYKNRKTRLSRTLAITVAALTAAAYLYVPWPAAMAVQTQLSKRTFDTSSIHATLDPSSKLGFSAGGRSPGIELDFPIAVTGVPEAIHVEADALAVSFQGAHGWTWKSGPYNYPALPKRISRSGLTVFNGLVVMPRASFNQARQQSVTLRATIYLTLFGNTRTKTVPLKNTFVNVIDGLQCVSALGPLGDMACRSPFRWPARVVYAKLDDSYVTPFRHSISYSPFPADLSLDWVEFESVSRPKTARELTIITKEPVRNLPLNFEVPNIRLADFVEATQ